MKALLFISLAAWFAVCSRGQTLENGRFVVRRSDDGLISIASKESGAVFLDHVQLAGRGGSARRMRISGTPFGTADCLKITGTDGLDAMIALYSDVPFVLVTPIAREAAVKNRIPVLSGEVRGENLTTFGTGGLLRAEKNPGSYVWQAAVDARTRHGAVFGWITQERASGVFFTHTNDGAVQIEARLDYGRVELAPEMQLETLAIGWFGDARLGLEAWADEVARYYDIHLKPQPAGYCTWYSKPNGGASDEKHLAELAAFAAKELGPFGFSVVQIDDKWQAGISTNGPNREFTRSRPNGPYPSGMKAAADQIRALGLTPGIWFMPFAGTYYDPAFKERQDWFVKRKNGTPYETDWGGTCLDMTRADARNYLRSLAETISRDWGFGYFKVDGLWTGTATRQQYVNSGYREDDMGDAVFSNPHKSNIEAYRAGLKTLREGAGTNVFILGCNGPQNMRSYGGAFGLVDGMRIGPDNGAEWKGLLRGPVFGSRHYFLNNRIWHNDPDPVYVRASMPLNHAQLICSWVAISGQLNLSSEWLPGLPADRLDILKRTMPAHGLKPRPADLFENDSPRFWLLTDTRRGVRRNVIGVFNWSKSEQIMEYPLDRLGLKKGTRYAAFDFWNNTLLPELEDDLKIRVPAESCRILSVRPVQDAPAVISTSRHVTQGIVDILKEQWNGHDTLSGTSAVVAGDPYELRILSKDTPAKAAVSAEDQAAGVSISIVSAEAGLARIRVMSPESRKVRWQVKFPQPR